MEIEKRVYELFFTEREKALTYIRIARKDSIQYNEIPRDELLRSNIVRIVNYTDDSGWSLLHQTCKEGDLEITTFLVDCGANVFRISYGRTDPLCVALQNKHHHVAKYLIEKAGAVPFWICRPKAGNGEYDDLFNGKAYISKKVLEDIRDEKYLALRLGRGKLSGYSINKSDLKLSFKEQPIWHAIRSGNATCVRVIVEYITLVLGCLERTSVYGVRGYPTLSVLYSFIAKARFLKFELLNSLDFALKYACKTGNLGVVKVLVDAKVPFDLCDVDISYGQIIDNAPWHLYTAVKYCNVNVVNYLLEKGADVRIRLYYKTNTTHKSLNLEKHVLRNSLDMLKCILRNYVIRIQRKVGNYEKSRKLILEFIGELVDLCLRNGMLDVYELILAIIHEFIDIHQEIDLVIPNNFSSNVRHSASYIFLMWFYMNRLHNFFITPPRLEIFYPYDVTLFDRLYFRMRQHDLHQSILNRELQQ
jgi:hypothetical protein